mmetsp:Transcript_2205/g.5196  ORF Transcript_2205/g.5196 Transcript_2205/m.5196 type:complete len:111 (+) Transcript_2205:113-445(+)
MPEPRATPSSNVVSGVEEDFHFRLEESSLLADLRAQLAGLREKKRILQERREAAEIVAADGLAELQLAQQKESTKLQEARVAFRRSTATLQRLQKAPGPPSSSRASTFRV